MAKPRKTIVKRHRRKGKPVKAHKRRIKGKRKITKRSYPRNHLVLTDDEREYILDTYDREPEDLPDYEVEQAIQERREMF